MGSRSARSTSREVLRVTVKVNEWYPLRHMSNNNNKEIGRGLSLRMLPRHWGKRKLMRGVSTGGGSHGSGGGGGRWVWEFIGTPNYFVEGCYIDNNTEIGRHLP